jgi:hypothetical protein
MFNLDSSFPWEDFLKASVGFSSNTAKLSIVKCGLFREFLRDATAKQLRMCLTHFERHTSGGIFSENDKKTDCNLRKKLIALNSSTIRHLLKQDETKVDSAADDKDEERITENCTSFESSRLIEAETVSSVAVPDIQCDDLMEVESVSEAARLESGYESTASETKSISHDSVVKSSNAVKNDFSSEQPNINENGLLSNKIENVLTKEVCKGKNVHQTVPATVSIFSPEVRNDETAGADSDEELSVTGESSEFARTDSISEVPVDSRSAHQIETDLIVEVPAKKLNSFASSKSSPRRLIPGESDNSIEAEPLSEDAADVDLKDEVSSVLEDCIRDIVDIQGSLMDEIDFLLTSNKNFYWQVIHGTIERFFKKHMTPEMTLEQKHKIYELFQGRHHEYRASYLLDRDTSSQHEYKKDVKRIKSQLRAKIERTKAKIFREKSKREQRNRPLGSNHTTLQPRTLAVLDTGKPEDILSAGDEVYDYDSVKLRTQEFFNFFGYIATIDAFSSDRYARFRILGTNSHKDNPNLVRWAHNTEYGVWKCTYARLEKSLKVDSEAIQSGKRSAYDTKFLVPIVSNWMMKAQQRAINHRIVNVIMQEYLR